MEINFASCTEEELWKYVASHLSKKGIDTVLVGGAVAAIYSNGLYRSGDLDFNFGSVKKWCVNEGAAWAYEDFMKKYKESQL